MCTRTVMTYASRVFAHAARKHYIDYRVQNKFCRAATDAHWCVRNSILHRDELPHYFQIYEGTILRHRGITSQCAPSRMVDYQPLHPTHLIRRPRNVLTDPPDALHSGS
ncbi:hypothetical protein EVAR_75024_1 [Eumeta japonica]|uniref:Uncharacterized protein n=1 Tax=Eumeta variegata TaxID=151549 RepID=A0A4C1VZW0_EUMVA|nr:hypothetical protein EVAR_75024_1 [Eumeta japonica]